MKRRNLIKKLKRPGGNHDIYTNGERNELISHTREIDEVLESVDTR